jgi:hypothetical protein
MDINNLHSLDFQMRKGVVFAEARDLDWDKEMAILQGEFVPLNPVRLFQSEGTKWTDFLRSSLATKIVSKRFIQVLEENHFSGWRAYETIITDKSRNESSDYYGLSITGRCGPANRALGTPFEKVFVPGGPKVPYRRGYHVGLDTWDGSDLFIPETTMYVVVTSNVRIALEKAKLTNLDFMCLADMEYPDRG